MAAVTHTIGVGRYLIDGPLTAVLTVATAGALGALVDSRLLRPARLARRPFVVRALRPERGGATTLELAAADHAGQPFRPGRVAQAGRRPAAPRRAPVLVLVQRPGSGASRDHHQGLRRRDARTDHRRAGRPRRARRPHGSYRPSTSATGFVLIAGGIGITPVMSLLRTHADTNDPRPHLLFYSSVGWDDVIFREELDALADRMALRVVHVLYEPHEDWSGERGLLDQTVLERHLPDELGRHDVFVCGPPGLTDAAVHALAAVGVPPEQVHTERYVHI